MSSEPTQPTQPARPTAEDGPYLSIIIPAYNEELRLPVSLQKIDEFLSRQAYSAEVIVVENGSTDHTSELVEQFQASHPYVRLLHSAKGKGCAVQTGMLAGHGQCLLICDADLAMPIDEVNKMLPVLQDGYDVVIASREGDGAIRFDEPYYRHLMGRVFNLVVRVLAIPGLQDTQCGFKMFRRAAARDVFARQTMTGWAFDVEVLAIALRRGYQVTEVPIHWYFMDDSKISPVRDTFTMVHEVIKIRGNVRRGMYDGA
jgi:dolichyl-phosphate beta-glucosyltransferase